MKTHATHSRTPSPAPAVPAPPLVHQVLRSPGRSLGPVSGFDLAEVRVHTDAEAARSARAVNADAYTAGPHIVFGDGKFSPETASGRDLLHHELQHVMQQRGATPSGPLRIASANSPLEHHSHRTLGRWTVQRRPAVNPTPASLDQFPLAEREALVSVQSPLPPAAATDIEQFFAPPAATSVKVSYTLPASIQIVFDQAIPSSGRTALTSVAAYLKGQLTPPLDLNQTRTIDIPALNSILRFSDIEHGKQEVMLVERVGTIPAAGASSATGPGKAVFAAKNYKFAPSFSDPGEQTQVYAALATIPRSTLLDGVTFARASKGSSNEAGDYNPVANVIRIFDSGFSNAGARSGVTTSLAQLLAHELGHAVDYAPLNTAVAAYQGSAFSPADKKKLLGARALSGTRETFSGQNLDDSDATRDTSGEFRVAATRDGIRPDSSKTLRTTNVGTAATLKGAPIDYGNTTWQELFADALSLYATDPHLLQTIRPHVYAYFAKRFP